VFEIDLADAGVSGVADAGHGDGLVDGALDPGAGAAGLFPGVGGLLGVGLLQRVVQVAGSNGDLAAALRSDQTGDLLPELSDREIRFILARDERTWPKIEELWGDRATAVVVSLVRHHVVRVRARLTRGGGLKRRCGHAACEYSCRTPPSRSCRRIRMLPLVTGSGSARSGAACCSARYGRCRLK
jgi:hypothetical protein